MKQILLFDNYDSFTYNLKHYLEALNVHVVVKRNNEVIENILQFDGIVLSPGPGLPKDAGDLMNVISVVKGKVPVLGVCLGMQAIAEYYNWELYNQEIVKHGISEKIHLKECSLFKNLPQIIEVGLYHSWAVKSTNDILKVTAFSETGTIMALENSVDKVFGVQFHPESILTPDGRRILANFVLQL